ncbi:hypothetical protein AVEN_137577-1 [Araneus ventricosus]|uniref:Uncharacterized protein n=1 Tax=Araneus ventricosus TaxID=182803 RepID=A0A4Y2GR06_ARAVE|nr:hypothetical protein AVEN_137577-1 [Araneus ventricosus]
MSTPGKEPDGRADMRAPLHPQTSSIAQEDHELSQGMSHWAGIPSRNPGFSDEPREAKQKYKDQCIVYVRPALLAELTATLLTNDYLTGYFIAGAPFGAYCMQRFQKSI